MQSTVSRSSTKGLCLSIFSEVHGFVEAVLAGVFYEEHNNLPLLLKSDERGFESSAIETSYLSALDLSFVCRRSFELADPCTDF